MTSKTRKVMASVLAALILLPTLLVGCGGNSTAVTTTEAISTQAATATTAAVETTAPVKPKGSITVWTWEQGKKSIDPSMDAFKAAYPDIVVKFELMTAPDLYKKMLLALSSGEGVPDVATYENSNLAQVVTTDSLTDLTDKVKPYMEKINKYKWADATKDGKIYAMPWDSGPVALYYRRDVFEKAGYSSKPEDVATLLSTWDKYYEVAKVIKQKTGVYMFSESKEKSTNRNFEKLLWQQGAWYASKDGKPNMDTPEAENALMFISKFLKEGLAQNLEEWTQPWYDSMKNGTVATVPAAVWMGGFISGFIAPDTKGKWGVAPLPAWKEGGVRTSNDGGSTLVIPKQSKNPDAAWAFIDYFLGREDAAIKMYQTADIFPSLNGAYSDKFFDEEMPFYGGEKVRRLFADLAKDIPEITYTKNYPIITKEMQTASQKVFLKNEDVAQALKEANESVTSKIGN